MGLFMHKFQKWIGGLFKGSPPKRGVDQGKMAATQSAILEKICGLRDTLRKYTDYEEIFASPDQNPLEQDMEGFCEKIHRLMENQFQGVKDAVQAEYSRDHIPKYVGLLSHNLEYVRRRFDSETVVDDSRIYAGLVEIVRTYLEYHLYDLDGDGDGKIDGNGDDFSEHSTFLADRRSAEGSRESSARSNDRAKKDVYWILFDQFPEVRNWAKEYVRNYAIIVTHSIILGPILMKSP